MPLFLFLIQLAALFLYVSLHWALPEVISAVRGLTGMRGEAALNDREASKTLQTVALSVYSERVWAEAEICGVVWQEPFSNSYYGAVSQRVGKNT